jgi:hypothetical protein
MQNLPGATTAESMTGSPMPRELCLGAFDLERSR